MATSLHIPTFYSRQSNSTARTTTVTTPDSVYTLTGQLGHYAAGAPRSHRVTLSVADRQGNVALTTPSAGHEYMYNKLGLLAGHKANNLYFNTGLTYNLRGQLKQMYTTLWKQDLKYDDAAEPCYNGNIAEMTLTPMWQQGVTRKYRYDKLDRLATLTFSRPDPQAQKYPHLNPYLYCAANPLRYTDPSGEDIWKIDESGQVVAYEATTEYDRFDFVDDDGNIMRNEDGEEQSVQFEYGTVLNYRQETYADENGKGVMDIFEIRGDQNGTELFEMMSKNVGEQSQNEIGLIGTGVEGKGRNFITSGHTPHKEKGKSILYEGQLKYLYFIREMTHSHPNSQSVSDNDIKAKNQIIQYTPLFNHSVPKFYIYHIKTNKYIQY